MKFTRPIYVDIHDEDFNGVARASAVLRYLQSAAWEHMRAVGPSGKELQDRGQAFILSALDLNIHTPVRAYQTLMTETWACKPRALTFPRGYALTDENGTVLAEAAAHWALVDLNSRALIRPSVIGSDYNAEDTTVRITRFVPPHADEMKLVGTYTVNYSETDYIGHLNNTYYPDMFTSFLPMRGKRVMSMSIHFLHEAPLGEKLSVYMKREDEYYLLLTMREDGQINADAKILLTDI